MICHEDLLPGYVITMFFVVIFLMVNALRGFTINQAHHRNRVKKGLPWDAHIDEELEDIRLVKMKYGAVLYYLSYWYVIARIKLFNKPYQSLFLITMMLFAGLKILLTIC